MEEIYYVDESGEFGRKLVFDFPTPPSDADAERIRRGCMPIPDANPANVTYEEMMKAIREFPKNSSEAADYLASASLDNYRIKD